MTTPVPYLQLVEHGASTAADPSSASDRSAFVLDVAGELRTVIGRAIVATERRRMLGDLIQVITSTRTAAESDVDGTTRLLADARASYDAANHALDASIAAVATTIDDHIQSRLVALVRTAHPSALSTWNEPATSAPADPARPMPTPVEESINATRS